MDSNHDIVQTLRLFDGVMMGLAADEIEALRKRVAELEAAAAVKVREPVLYQCRTRPTWDDKHPWSKWEECSKEAAADYRRTPLFHDWAFEVRELFDGSAVSPATADERAAFEAKFPVPHGIKWDGGKYVVCDGYENSYRADRFVGQWLAWQAARASQAAAPAEAREPLVLWQDGTGMLWDTYSHGKWMHRVVSPHGWDAHGVAQHLYGKRYAGHLEVRAVWSGNYAAPADAREPVGWFDKSLNQIRWRDGLVNADFADRQPFYTYPVSAPADAGEAREPDAYMTLDCISLKPASVYLDREEVADMRPDHVAPLYRGRVPADAAEAVIPPKRVDEIMAQAQVFASAWSLVGGRFDQGDALETAEQEKQNLRDLVSGAQGGKGGEA